MAVTNPIPPITSAITAAVNNTPATTQTGTSGATAVDKTMLAGNFQTFLTLLTTQLKNQNPLDPLDTNQFTQQLVQFAQVEQQLRQNEQLATLVSIEKTAQATTPSPSWVRTSPSPAARPSRCRPRSRASSIPST